jgi:hypothetical protein
MTAVRRMTVKVLGTAIAALALALGAPAAAQDSDAPVDVTVAPPPSADTIGPAQLQNFNLQGRVTRPAEGTAPVQPVPAAPSQPTVADPVSDGVASVTSSESVTRRPAPAARTQATPAAVAPPSTTGSVTPSLPLDVTTGAAPQPSYDDATAPSASPLAPEGGLLSWPWIAALIALTGGGAYIAWSRRGQRQRYGDPGRMAFAGLVPDAEAKPAPVPPVRPRPDPVPPRGQPAPRPDPVPPKPASAPRPDPASDGLIVSTALKPELNVLFQPDRAVVTENEVLLQFDVVLTNSGSAPARDVLVEAKLVPAYAGQDQEIATFFKQPQATGDRMATIPPLGKVALKSAVRLPIDQLRSFEVEGRTLFVPLVAFNVLFRSGVGEGQASASYLVGRGNDEDEKLAPFRLDLGPRIFRGLSARPHSMGLTR